MKDLYPWWGKLVRRHSERQRRICHRGGENRKISSKWQIYYAGACNHYSWSGIHDLYNLTWRIMKRLENMYILIMKSHTIMRNWYVHFVVGCCIIETIMYRNHTIRFWSGWGRVESDIQSCCGMERILIIHGSMMVRLFLPAEPLFVIGVMAENGRYPWSDWGRDDGGVLIMDMFYWDIRGKSRSRCDICVRNIHRNLRALCAAA